MGGKMKNYFRGTIVPLITPFRGGRVDFGSLGKIIDRCLDGGANGFVALGTTAETPALTEEEKISVFSFIKDNSSGKPVIAGAGSNCTREAVRLTKLFCSLGADAILSVCPFYNKPPETGIIAHFCLIAESSSAPVLLYDVPSRTGCEIPVPALKILSAHPNITGLKAAYSSVERISEAIDAAPNGFEVFCGNDLLTDDALNLGSAGTISAAANFIPYDIAKTVEAEKGERSEKFLKIRPLIQALYTETNPVIIKYALSKIGLCENELRLPMCPISRKNAEFFDKTYSNYLKENDT